MDLLHQELGQTAAVSPDAGWSSQERSRQVHFSLQRGVPVPVQSGPHWATLEVGSPTGAHPAVHLLFSKTSVTTDLQVADRRPRPATSLSGSYLGMPASDTWCTLGVNVDLAIACPCREEKLLVLRKAAVTFSQLTHHHIHAER